MTILQLRYFITIVEKGKMSEAAKELFISQPSLTSAIKELEDELGFQLLNRTNRGISITKEGTHFLTYARQVIEQMSILESTFFQKKQEKFVFQISAQHYSFVVEAFLDFIQNMNSDEYEVTLKECRTYEIIDDVKNNRSQLGVIYLNDFNRTVLRKYFNENHLDFTELFIASPHIIISKSNPLANKDTISLDDLKDYPFLSFEQGEYNSFYFSEEILSTITRKKIIKVSDRVTLLHLLTGLNGYTITTGIMSKEWNGEKIVIKPLDVEENIHIGLLTRKDEHLTYITNKYIELLKKHIGTL